MCFNTRLYLLLLFPSAGGKAAAEHLSVHKQMMFAAESLAVALAHPRKGYWDTAQHAHMS